MKNTKFVVRNLGGRWYVMHVRTGTIVPAGSNRVWYPTEGAARKAAVTR